MLVVKVEVDDADVPTMVLSDVAAALSCHLMMWSMCGKYVEMWRCALDQMVSWLMRLMIVVKMLLLVRMSPLLLSSRCDDDVPCRNCPCCFLKEMSAVVRVEFRGSAVSGCDSRRCCGR